MRAAVSDGWQAIREEHTTRVGLPSFCTPAVRESLVGLPTRALKWELIDELAPYRMSGPSAGCKMVFRITKEQVRNCWPAEQTVCLWVNLIKQETPEVTVTKQNPPTGRQGSVTLPLKGGGGMWRWQCFRKCVGEAAGVQRWDLCAS